MSIEYNIFRRYSVDYNKLSDFGFKREFDCYIFETNFHNGEFKAIIKIDKKEIVKGVVYEIENNDEYLPLRVENQDGAFVNSVRSEYEKILVDIRENCFIKNYYVFPQSNRITDLIMKEYGDMPEFLWEKFQGSGVFRNPKSKKWYAAILEVDKNRLQKGKSGIVEVLDIKLNPEHILKLLQKTNFYPAYHMNKKYWITIILDDSLTDSEIMNLIKESHSFT